MNGSRHTRAALAALLAAGMLTFGTHQAQPQPAGRFYYVAKSGNDRNPGTAERPWLTLSKACESVVAGDTVCIRAGTYNERLVPKSSGAAGREITFTSLGQGPVVLDGAGIPLEDLAGVVHLSDRSFIRVVGLQVTNSQEAGILAEDAHDLLVKGNRTSHTGSSGIGIWGCQRVVLDGNTVEGAGANGRQECISVSDTDTFEVANNTVRNGRKEGLCIKEGARNGKVYLNQVYDNLDGVGIYVDAWNRHTYNIELMQNVAHGNNTPGRLEGVGIALASEMGGLLENVRIYNNIVYHNGALGLQVSTNGDSAKHPMRGIRIVNNTFYNNGWTEWGGGIAVDNPDASDLVVRNNICCKNLTFQIAVCSTVPKHAVTVDHNLVYPFLESEDEIRGAQAVSADPRFVNAAAADFHLLAGSPAIDRGASADAPPLDYEGAARPQGGGSDLGALEYAGK